MRDGALLRGSATPATVRVAIPTMRDGPLFRGLATPELTVGRVVIPTLARFDYNLFAPESRTAFLSARQRMFAQGLYPGVDYLVEERSAGGALSVRPTYPLRKKLEREWPIVVEPELAPRWLTPFDYNLLTAAFALGLAGGGLAAAACLTACFTLSVVTSESMVPTLLPRDVVLVEKVTGGRGATPGELLFFRPPEPLRAIVRERGGAVADGTLFVKRVAGTAGARVAVQRDGATTIDAAEVRGPVGRALAPLVRAGEYAVRDGEFFVLGDNRDASIDSRCWGVLRGSEVAGRPLWRVLPLSRWGAVEARSE